MISSPVVTPPISRGRLTDPQALYSQLRVLQDSLEIQLNQKTGVSSTDKDDIENGLKPNDLVFRLVNNVLKIGMFNGKNVRFLGASDLQALQNPNPNTQFKGLIENTTAVGSATTLSFFPNKNDWGFYSRTSTADLYYVFNLTGSTLKYLLYT